MRPTTTSGPGPCAAARPPAAARPRRSRASRRVFISISESYRRREDGRGRCESVITAAVRPRPLETLNLATLAVLSTLTLVLWRRLPSPGGLLLRYGLMAAAVLIVVWLWPREKKLPSPV